MTQMPLTTIIVGAGHRALSYASYALHHPNKLRIVGVSDPIEFRRKRVAEIYKLSPKQCFKTAEEVARQPKMSDVVINGTMDQQHVPTSLLLLAAGYDILLEKPFATNKQEMLQLIEASTKYKRKIIICHVLRYAPFYAAIRQRVINGDIGEVINIQTSEHVSYHHMAVGFVRGKWNREDVCKSSMLMAKCCHDLDLIMWMKSGIAPRSVSSIGSNMQFRPEKAPSQAGIRCLRDCPIEEKCLYSARKHYIDHPDRWNFYVWDSLEHIPNPSIEQKLESLKTNNPYGKCVWRCNSTVVDHQSVMIEFEDGCTATHNMVGGVSRPMRSIHLLGTTGEIQGVMEEGTFVLRHPDPRPRHEYSEQQIELDVSGDMHGGGDLRLVEDFVRVVRGEAPSVSTTLLKDSVYGHLVGFGADASMSEGRMIELEKL